MKKSVKILWITVFFGMGLFILMLLLINFRVIGNMPSIENLENPGPKQAFEVNAENRAIGEKCNQANRSNSNYDEISKNVINALITMEDVHFYDHSGFKPEHIMATIFSLIIGKGKYSGTITQQLALKLLADNVCEHHANNIVERGFQKVQECLLTVKLERHFTKQEIIAHHLNTALFGDNVYGIENAACTFFGKDAGHLALEEAATLIGMLKGRNLYNPLRNLNRSLLRRNVVIELMEKRGFITEKEANEAISKPIVLRYN
jgi:penicillin-binding protein 1A